MISPTRWCDACGKTFPREQAVITLGICELVFCGNECANNYGYGRRK